MTNNLPAFDELNNIRSVLTGEVDEMVFVKRDLNRKRLEDIIFELITMGYVYGLTVAGLDLEADIPVDRAKMESAAWKRTAGENFSDRIGNHVSEAVQRLAEGADDPAEVARRLAEQLAVIAETETHRAINTGAKDGADEYADEHPGVTIFKQWQTMLDDRVREEHQYLEGATVPLDARFYSWSGDSARFPGDFVLPENNVNCRCVLRFTAR